MVRDDYWARRALADEAAAERLARQAAKEMRRVYREQYEAVLREIEGLMAEVAEGGTPTRTQLWNYARWRRLEERLREFAGEASRRCEQTVTDCLDEVFRTVIGADVADATGTVWRASISPQAVLETAWSGEHYSTRIWHNTAAIAQRVRDDVTDMIVQGKGISQVRRRLMEDFSAAYSDADRLVRTEAAYVRNQAALTRYRQNGRRKVRWITGESDGRECSVCRERDGKEYDIDAAPRLPAHPNCRCCYAPVVEAGLTQRGENGIIDVDAYNENLAFIEQDAKIKANSGLPKVLKRLPDETIKATVDVRFDIVKGVVPKGAEVRSIVVLGGKGTSTPIRDLRRLYETYPDYGDASDWQKKSGSVQGDNFIYEVHWYEANGRMPPTEIKTKRVRK